MLKATDYPPTANAGQPQIVELPENSVTLDGSQSSDDHEITAWEWTKDASDSAKAVDMQDTRTPFLHLSNLEEGIYTFVLKVTDASNQSNTASVRVFVKPPSNKPPQANAGQNVTINLPQTWTMLNATNSTDDVKISSYQWTQIEGPNTANIADKNAVVTNATGLAVGTYTFEVFVIDENHKNATSRVRVVVVQGNFGRSERNRWTFSLIFFFFREKYGSSGTWGWRSDGHDAGQHNLYEWKFVQRRLGHCEV